MIKINAVTAPVIALLLAIAFSSSAHAATCGGVFIGGIDALNAATAACNSANSVTDCSTSGGSQGGTVCNALMDQIEADSGGGVISTPSRTVRGPNFGDCTGSAICYARFDWQTPPPGGTPPGCTDDGTHVSCIPPEPPGETNDCSDRNGDTYDQYCGNEQPCFALTCQNGCAISHTGTDTSGSLITIFQYTYSGSACGESNQSVAAENLPPGTTLITETETEHTETQTNPDGSTTTTTQTETVVQSTGGGSGGATAEEIGDELTEDTPPDTDYTGDMDGAFDQLNDEFDSIEDALSDPNDFTGSTSTSLITSLLPTSGCTGSISIPLFNSGETLSVTCSDTTELRTILSWLIVVFAAIYIFHMITTKPA